MRRGLLALLVLLGGSSIAFAQFQFVAPPGTTPATTKVSADEVVARIMTFDQNSDGRVAIGELSERMRPLVERGDKDGDRALDPSEIATLSRAPVTQTRRAVFPGSGYSFGEDVGLSSKQHLEGALDDLRLTSDKRERALPRIGTYVEQVEAAARADLLGQMEPLLSPEQLRVFTQALNNQSREVTLRTNVSGVAATQAIRMMMTGDLARRVDGIGLPPSTNKQAQTAIGEYKSRLRLERETDRVALLAQLKDVLGNEELDDFGAAIARRPVVANGRTFVMVNDASIRAPQLIDVARPAVLIERGFPANGVTVR